MKKGIRKVVLVGDMPTKVEFISQFLNENLKVSLKELCRDGAPLVEVSHADNFEENIITDKTKTNISVLSVAFPDGILLSVDLSETDWISCKNLQDTELILFVEGFPFATDTLIDRIVLIEKFLMTETRRKSFKSVQFRVVFFKNKNQHFGDTDIVDINKALKYAPDCVTKGIDKNNKCMFPINSLLDFKIYEDVDDCIDVVSCKMKTLKILTAVGEKQLNLWRSELEYYFEDYRQEYDYQFSDALRFETIHNNVNKFAVVKGSNDIMERYAENYFKKCFDEVKKLH